MNEQAITSMEVAGMIRKEHKNVIRDIRLYIAELTELKIEPSSFFSEGTYKDATGRTLPCFQVTKKGCEFIAHKLTGIKGTEFTAKYIERFHDMEASLQHGFDLTELSPELQAIFVHDKKIQAVLEHMEDHEARIDNLEDTMTVDYGQQKNLNDKHHAVGIEALGGRKSAAYQDRKLKEKVFRTIWKDYKDYFGTASYRDTPAARYKEAMKYLEGWIPDTNLKLEIQSKNREAA